MKANHQDSVYLFAYSVNQGKSGLLLAWSLDQDEWHAIGQEHTFLFSDFGTWGSQKRMFSPFLFRDKTGEFHCYWSPNTNIQQLAHASSTNLYDWSRQSYPFVMTAGNVLDLEVQEAPDGCQVSWISEQNGKREIFKAGSRDYKNFTGTISGSEADRLNCRMEVEINGIPQRGMAIKVPWKIVEDLIQQEEWEQFHERERMESMSDDPVRFSRLSELNVSIIPHPDDAKPISDMLIGIFFEDISYAADGGLYAELIQNRDFEYNTGDRDFRDSSWNARKAWSVSGGASFSIEKLDPVHKNNPHYASVRTGSDGGTFENEGWDGIVVHSGELYDFSVFARLHERSKANVGVKLVNPDNEVIGKAEIKLSGSTWKKYQAEIPVKESSEHARLVLTPASEGMLDLDMVSLFPRNTFMGRKNGLRQDLARVIADLHPRFVRFPGGCVVHGDGLENLYKWENTIGPLEARVPQKNIWNYHQSAGLGYFEYFQFCEDIGAEPVPVVPAGVPCQNSHTGGHGQQCGIPMEDMDEYVQSVLNLIEWANGDKKSEWGRKRADAGHPEPFNLKYIGVGNEDLITDVFEERFTMIYQAIKEKYPEIIIIGTVGPFYRGTDYVEGWDIARKLNLEMVDEHYYQPPGWFINNQDFYDKYDREGTKVYLGEYASHVRGRRTNMETSLSEALYLTAIERNADVVSMTSYAPLLAKEGHTNWNPDLIYFNNSEVKPTVDYYVQQLFSLNSGTEYIPSLVELSDRDQSVRRRLGVSFVTDRESGDLIIKLVNLLPVDIESDINLSEFTMNGEGTCTVLRGEPRDEKARPEEMEINIDTLLQYRIPRYSMSVIRIKQKN